MGVLGEFKRGVDVAHGDWFDVREGTHLLGEHPLHPYTLCNSDPFSISTIIGLIGLNLRTLFSKTSSS
ncbi:hypothetical protein HanRHA438_Chr17g0839361 [Helianthus annuus]|nr:hypothetical protein HanRHA438_Chr17g0839361 [Helianthus annuus]